MAYLFFVGAIVVLLDQLTKLLIVRFLPLYTVKIIIPGWFDLVHVTNTGAAFSFLAGAASGWRQGFFVIASLVGIGVVIFAYRHFKKQGFWTRTALALVFGGAVGNLIDRIRLGQVVDFLDFHFHQYHWPAFNVADSAITVGAVMLLISLFRAK